MKLMKVRMVFAILGLAVVLGRLFDGAPLRAEVVAANPIMPCQDIDGDGQSNLTDTVYLLSWLFLPHASLHRCSLLCARRGFTRIALPHVRSVTLT